jgi:type I restriction enzyme S subunit
MFCLRSPLTRHFLDTWANTTAQPTFNLKELANLPVPVAPPSEQRAIAGILGTLDDKIELNHQTNETLEAMVRALFKSWFVDFDPVRAKANGRAPSGMDADTAKLFPSELVESELGAIPKGWRVTEVGALVELEKGLSYKGSGLGSGLPMINLGCFLGHGRFEAAKVKLYNGDHRERHLVGVDELVLANTDMTQNRVTLGSPAIVAEWGGHQRFLFSHHTYAARRKAGAGRHWVDFLCHLLQQDSARERAAGFATGTTVLALPRDAITGLRFAQPTEDLVTRFSSLSRTLRQKQHGNVAQSTVLASVRDALLPGLISGRIPLECRSSLPEAIA